MAARFKFNATRRDNYLFMFEYDSFFDLLNRRRKNSVFFENTETFSLSLTFSGKLLVDDPVSFSKKNLCRVTVIFIQ